MLIAQYQNVSQFEPGESDCECGPYAVALNKFAGQDAPSGSAEDVDNLADQLWGSFKHDPHGVDVATLLSMLDSAGVQYQKIGSVEGNDHVENLTHDVALQWLNKGYPLICTINESDVFDVDLNSSPYPWLQREPYKSDPPNHIITLAGIADDGNVLVADPANAGSFPLHYQLDSLNFITLVAVVPSWTPDGGEMKIIDLNDHVVAYYFTATPDGKWRCNQTGHTIHDGMLKFYRSFGQDGYCGLTYLGLPLSEEEPIEGHAGVVRQQFERAVLAYDPSHVVDQPPGASSVYLMHNP